MADSTLSALPAASALSGSELFYSVQSAADVKVTATQLKTFALAAPLTITGVANTSVLTSTGYSLTGANAQSMIDLAGTLNTSGSPDVLALRITDTARGASTKLLNVYAGAAGATSAFSIDRLGNILIMGAVAAGAGIIDANGASSIGLAIGGTYGVQFSSASGVGIQGNALFAWAPANDATGGKDTIIKRRGAANIQFGAADAAAPVAQSLSVQSVVAGTSNTAGVDTNITGSLSTGSGIAGKIVFNLSQIVAAATTQNASSSVLSLNTIAASGIQFPRYGAGALSTDASGNITATSDERLKHVEGPFAAGLDELMGIEPILYKWTDESGMETEHVYAGLGAGNVRETIPEAVGVSGDGYLTLSDRALLAACVNAIKQLAKEVRH